MDKIEKHWDEFSEKYAIYSNCLATMTFELWNMLKVSEADSILDVGCGPGYLLPHLSQIKKPSCEVIALDLSQMMVQLAIVGMDKYVSQLKVSQVVEDQQVGQKQFKIQQVYPQLNMTIGKGNAEDLNEIQDESFQVYSSSLVLHLTKNADQMLKEAYRVLKPQGRIGCSVWGSLENSNIMLIVDEVLDQNGVIRDKTARSPFYLNDRKTLIEMFQKYKFKNIICWTSIVPYSIFGLDGMDFIVKIPRYSGLIDAQPIEVQKKIIDDLKAKLDNILHDQQKAITLEGLFIIAEKESCNVIQQNSEELFDF